MENVKAAIVNPKRQKIKIIDSDAIGPIDFALQRHNKLESYDYDVYHPNNALCCGTGRLGKYNIAGTNRLVFAARSPLWEGFYISSMGGVGVNFINAGLHFMSIEGKSNKFTFFALKKEKGKFKNKFVTISREKLDDLYFKGCMGWRGIWAVEGYILKQLKEWFNSPFRVVATGPSALYTRLGALASTVVDSDGTLSFGQEDFAGRAALGSLAVQGHGVFAFAIGGDEKLQQYDKGKLETLFKETYDAKPNETIMKTTEKYRYAEKLETGGTFGVNYTELRDKTLMFNWKSTYWPYNRRMKAYEALITPYLNTFNEEIIKTKSWKNCGENCPVVCKKIHVTKKKDYEPYSATGPNSGVFDMMDAETVVHRADTFCFDAIEFGTITSWLMECAEKGLLTEKELGVDIKPIFDFEEYAKNPKASSYRNAMIIRHIANMIVNNHGIGKFVAEGIRMGAKELDKTFPDRTKKAGVKFRDLAPYIPFGKNGSLAPAQYWTPGCFAPVAIPHLSKTYYGVDIWEPEQLGAKCAERYIAEMGIDELGICRFHRKWISKIAAKLAEIEDYEAHEKRISKELVEYNKKAGNDPVFWESTRTKEIVENFLINFRTHSKNNELDNWIAKFGNSIDRASRNYWELMKKGFDSALE